MKIIVLDRDGVINYDSDQFIKSPEEWKPIPGSLEAIARLNESGWRVVVASNQSGVGRGLFDMDTLNAINDKMVKALGQAGGVHVLHTADGSLSRLETTGVGRAAGVVVSVDCETLYVAGWTDADVPALLDLIYVNEFANLRAGRGRYSRSPTSASTSSTPSMTSPSPKPSSPRCGVQSRSTSGMPRVICSRR